MGMPLPLVSAQEGLRNMNGGERELTWADDVVDEAAHGTVAKALQLSKQKGVTAATATAQIQGTEVSSSVKAPTTATDACNQCQRDAMKDNLKACCMSCKVAGIILFKDSKEL